MKYALLFVLLPSLAQADAFCDELWFTRNLIFDRAGYCFGSPLGRAVFDNGDCDTKTPSLSVKQKRDVAFLKETEGFAGCKVNTKRTRLVFTGTDWLRSLATLPIRDLGESACLGYTGSDVDLRSGTSDKSAITGILRKGDHVNYAHLQENGWSYATTSSQKAGWMSVDLYTTKSCTNYAG